MNTLKLLTIGNSFSDDMMEYAYKIAKDLGITNIVLGNLVIGGCNIERHYNNTITKAKDYEFRYNVNDEWITIKESTIDDGINFKDWDYISFQQSSYDSGVLSSYENLSKLLKYVRSKNKNAKFVWYQTWAYDEISIHPEYHRYNNNQKTMFKAINEVIEQVIMPFNFYKIIKVGQAIQNARNTFLKEKLTRDTYHLSFDIGRYLAGLTFVSNLLDINVDDKILTSDLSDEIIQVLKKCSKVK